MPRPRANNVRLVVQIPRHIAEAVDQRLYSPLHGRTLFGSRGVIVGALLKLWLESGCNIVQLSNALNYIKTQDRQASDAERELLQALENLGVDNLDDDG
jgi:hypothetical protein